MSADLLYAAVMELRAGATYEDTGRDGPLAALLDALARRDMDAARAAGVRIAEWLVIDETERD